MKPKTKLQKKVVGLSKLVDPVSEEDKQWAQEAIFDNYFVECRNRYNCLECGHKWDPNNAELSKHILPTTCPECEERNINHVDHWDTDESKYEYWAIIDVVEDFQVVRMFFTEKYMKRKQPAQYIHSEVMQHWIREDGKMTSLTMLANSMGGYNCYDSWSYGSDLEVRTNSRNHQLRCGITPFKIRPGRNTLPIIRRNGYNGYFKGVAPHLFFQAILKHSEAETLLKAGQIPLFIKCVSVDGEIHQDVENYWDSICIAMRHDYIVEDASDWLDYLSFLEELDKDLHNPEYVCPDNFKEAHDRYAEKIRRKRKKERREKRRKKALRDQAEYIENMGCFFDLQISAGDIKIVPLKSPKEFLDEGEKLHHCIGSGRYYKNPSRLVLSARKEGQTIETIAINLKDLEITQARGLQNQPSEHHEEIVNAVRDNLDKIAKREQKREVAA